MSGVGIDRIRRGSLVGERTGVGDDPETPVRLGYRDELETMTKGETKAAEEGLSQALQRPRGRLAGAGRRRTGPPDLHTRLGNGDATVSVDDIAAAD